MGLRMVSIAHMLNSTAGPQHRTSEVSPIISVVLALHHLSQVLHVSLTCSVNTSTSQDTHYFFRADSLSIFPVNEQFQLKKLHTVGIPACLLNTKDESSVAIILNPFFFLLSF